MSFSFNGGYIYPPLLSPVKRDGKMAPVYATLVLGFLEKNATARSISIARNYSKDIALHLKSHYYRYLDDIFYYL